MEIDIKSLNCKNENDLKTLSSQCAYMGILHDAVLQDPTHILSWQDIRGEANQCSLFKVTDPENFMPKFVALAYPKWN